MCGPEPSPAGLLGVQRSAAPGPDDYGDLLKGLEWEQISHDLGGERRRCQGPSARCVAPKCSKNLAEPRETSFHEGVVGGHRPMRNAAPCGKISRDHYLDSQAYPAKLTMYLLPARHAERPRAGLFFVL